MSDMKMPIPLTSQAVEELRVVCFEIVQRLYEKDIGGRSIVSFWERSRAIPSLPRDYGVQLHFKKSRVDVAGLGYEQDRWTVHAYKVDYKKELPFSTREESKTLVFKDALLHPDDAYAWLDEYEENYDE